MAAKKKNHTVTRGYLAGWQAVDQKGVKGLWYFDLMAQEIAFAPSLNAHFAISKGIYSPRNVEGRRDDRFENWIAESEDDLCRFARNYTSAKPVRTKPGVVLKAINAIVSMGYRSEHAIHSLGTIFSQEKPELDDETRTLLVLNHLYAVAHDRMKFFRAGTIRVLCGVDKPLLTNDQPFWDMTPQDETRPLGFFPLSPSCLMLLAPFEVPPGGGFRVVIQRAADCEELVSFARSGAMRMARKWVVCPSQSEALKVAEYLTPERILETTSTDKLRLFPLAEDRTLFPI